MRDEAKTSSIPKVVAHSTTALPESERSKIRYFTLRVPVRIGQNRAIKRKPAGGIQYFPLIWVKRIDSQAQKARQSGRIETESGWDHRALEHIEITAASSGIHRKAWSKFCSGSRNAGAKAIALHQGRRNGES